METSLYQRVAKIYDDIPFDHEYWGLINGQLKRQLLERYVDDLALLMKNDKISFISKDNWSLIADVITGKVRKKAGRKPGYDYFRNELITLKVMELYAEQGDILLAIDNASEIIAERMCPIGSSSVRAIYYEYKGSYGPDFTIEDIRTWGLEMQERVNREHGETTNTINLF